MAIYSCNYPIWHTFDTSHNEMILYYIKIGETQIYAGKLFPYNTAEKTLDIDISEICREYLETFYEDMLGNKKETETGTGTISGLVPVNGLLSTIITFKVRSDYNAPEKGATEAKEEVSYTVAYDYNTDYNSELDEVRYLNDPIDNKVDPRQLLFISGYNMKAIKQIYFYQIGNGTKETLGISNEPEYRFQLLGIPLSYHEPKSGDIITLTMDGFGSEEYIVIPPRSNHYALYYVNKYGGLDSLLLTGKNLQSWNPTHTNVNLYSDRGKKTTWQQKRINSTIDHKWELNTGLLTNKKAAKIDHLIYSPKVMLHDLFADTITTVLIEDTTYSVKQHPYDIPQYTITVKESQKQIRR